MIRPLSRLLAGWPCLLALMLAACASNDPSVNVGAPTLAASVDRLNVDVGQVRLAPRPPHRFDPSHGMDPTDIAVLAVLNSPELAAKRASAKIMAAQAFSAGLLPDPQVTLGIDFPLHPAPGVTTAYTLSPSLDLTGLITRSTALRAARASGRQADLDLLWSEWGTAQQARLLALTIMAGDSKIALLRAIVQGLDVRIGLAGRALSLGDSSLSTNAGELGTLVDARSQLDMALRDTEKARGDLNALIGIAPSVRLHLVADPASIGLNDRDIETSLASLPGRRPDLLALRAGRQAQDANLRKAILARFPLINLGFSHQRDNSAIVSNGPAATLVFPIFNGGRGDIAVQSATRDSLTAEYQARLDQTVADVAAARRDRDQARQVLERLRDQLPAFIAAADRARAAERRRDIDSAAFLALEQAALRARISILDQTLALDTANLSLETVLFAPSDRRGFL